MRSDCNAGLPEDLAAAASGKMLAGLRQLLEAAAYAREVGRPVWDFAVEIESLRAAGLSNSELRWLVCKGYVEHARETTAGGSEGRGFEPEGGLRFGPGTCFVLTERGADVLRRPGKPAQPGRGPLGLFRNGGDVPGAGPHWDPECRVLSVGGRVVKQFRVPAGNQELILAALQELGWPPHLDDPLPPVPEVDAKQRLRDTISRLNGNQRNRLIRFHGDGSGSGLRWELLG